MQKLILVKDYPSVQLAHLYEHLFCMQIKRFFYDHNLYKYLDFSLYGTTFNQGGLIEIDLEFYTPEASDVSGQLLAMPLVFNQDDIFNAYNQLIAEEEQSVNVESIDALIEALKELDAQPWQTIDEFEIFDAKNVHRKLLPIYLTNKRALPARNLTLALCLDPKFATKNRELIPLFYTLSQVLLLRTQDGLSLSQAYYADELTLSHSTRKTAHQALLKAAYGRHREIDIEQDLHQSLAIISDMRAKKLADRLCKALGSISYIKDPFLAPSTQTYFEKTGVYIGSKGWKQIATPENCELLLKNMSIEIKFGREKVSKRLIS